MTLRSHGPLAVTFALVLALAGVLAPASGFAQDGVTVFSNRADSVAVTIYPNDLALITETRTVELPASAATLVIRDVADTLLPQSAVVNGLGRPLAESNFAYNRLSPQSLLRQAVGQTVALIRTDPATGVATRVPAVLRAAGEGVVLETDDGTEALHCSGLPEGIVFDAIPDGLYATPQLSLELAAGVPGEKTIQVSYLAHGLEWTADYVAQFQADADRLDLTGWATVTNSSGKRFEQAELQLIAGKLNMLAENEGGSRAEPVRTQNGESPVDARERLAEQAERADALLLRDCFEADLPSPEFPLRGLGFGEDTIIVTGTRLRRESFGDYHLYRLSWRTDLGARQTKQLRFLELDDVGVERFYRLEVASFDPDRLSFNNDALGLVGDESTDREVAAAPPIIVVHTENTAANGLGEPLPEGRVRFFETYGSRPVFVGQDYLADRPVGADIDLRIALPVDVMVEAEVRASEDNRWRVAADYRALNDKTVPIDLEIRHYISGETDFAVDETSRPYEIDGGYIVWRFPVPPGSETLSYRLSMAERQAR